MVWLSLTLVLLASGVLITVIGAAMLAHGLTHPRRMSDGKALAILKRLSPSDLALPFESIAYDIPDAARPGQKLHIAAWWIAAAVPSDRTVLLLHGYADAKVGSIAWAPIFHKLGWNVLAIDHRAHGESGGTATTAGHFEKHDTSAVIDQLLATRPNQTRHLVLFGISMGSAIAVHTAALRDDIAGVIAESFVGDFIFASRTQTHLLGLPGGIIVSLGSHIAAWMTGADFRRDTALAALPNVKCPVLLILGDVDPYADLVATLAMTKDLPNVTVWQPTGVDHVRAMASGYDDYVARITLFLNGAISAC